MAAKLVFQVRFSRTLNHSHFLSPLLHNLLQTTPPPLNSSIPSPAFHCRQIPGAGQSQSNESKISNETLAFVNEGKCNRSGGNGARVSTISSLDEAEVAKFPAMADTWSDVEGLFKPLHALNPTRLAFIRSTLCHHFSKDPNSTRPFQGLKFVDVGCGGGILSEVIEQVANPVEFCESLATLMVANGATVISTVNRTMRGYATTIVAAEHILKWIPKGTHEWSKFLTPEELASSLQRSSVKEMAGFVYNPLTGKWAVSNDVSLNYIAFGTKNAQ